MMYVYSRLGLPVYPMTVGPGFSLGTLLRITVPINSSCNVDVNTRLNLNVWEGCYFGGDVNLIATYSEEAVIAAGGTHNFQYYHTVQEGPQGIMGEYFRRDLKATFEYHDGSKWVVYSSHNWEDLYHVQAYQFEVGTPIVEAV